MQAKEDELIARSLQKDTEAYAELVKRYEKALYYHAYAIVRDEDVAEDVTQESFIAAYYKLVQYNQNRRFSTWLFKIATNNALMALRKDKYRAGLDDTEASSMQSNYASPQEKAEQTEIHQAVKKLEPKFRAVISLYYWQGCSIKEISQIMRVPEGTVKGWMYRAKVQLKRELS